MVSSIGCVAHHVALTVRGDIDNRLALYPGVREDGETPWRSRRSLPSMEQVKTSLVLRFTADDAARDVAA
jgi:hypothetical protein